MTDWQVPETGLCITCGRELGAEPHLIVCAPDGEHLGCRDWSGHPWPSALEQLGRRIEARVRALRIAMDLVTEFGSILVDRRRAWPAGASETVAEVERRSRELSVALDRAGLRGCEGGRREHRGGGGFLRSSLRACCDPFVDARLIPINAVVALHHNGGWPRPLGDAGLLIRMLEAPFGDVKADCLSVAESAGYVVLFECKSGANIETAQAEGYAALTLADVARLMTLPFAASRGKLAIVYVCLERHASRIRLGMKKAKRRFPLLVIGESRVRLEGRAPKFLAGIDVPVPGPPPVLIPVDDKSPATEYKAVLIAQMMAALARGEPTISLDSLVGRLPMFDSHGRGARQHFRKKALEALREIEKQPERERFFRLERGGSEPGLVVRFLKAPHRKDPRGATQSWQSLQRAASTALNTPHQPRQLELESIWDLARDLEMKDDEP